MKLRVRVLTSVISLLAVMFTQQICLAQVDPWEQVKLIEQGANVHVKLHSGKTVKGKMESWNTDGLSVRQKNEVLSLAKSDVRQVVAPIGMSRGRRAAWAAAIGGGSGAVVGGVLCGPLECIPRETAEWVGGLGLLVGGIAAGIAALFPQDKVVIYSAGAATEPREVSSALPAYPQVRKPTPLESRTLPRSTSGVRPAVPFRPLHDSDSTGLGQENCTYLTKRLPQRGIRPYGAALL